MDPDEDWICEETAWGVIEQRGWIASPELLMYLTQYVREVAEEGNWWTDKPPNLAPKKGLF